MVENVWLVQRSRSGLLHSRSQQIEPRPGHEFKLFTGSYTTRCLMIVDAGVGVNSGGGMSVGIISDDGVGSGTFKGKVLTTVWHGYKL